MFHCFSVIFGAMFRGSVVRSMVHNHGNSFDSKELTKLDVGSLSLCFYLSVGNVLERKAKRDLVRSGCIKYSLLSRKKQFISLIITQLINY